MSALSLPELYQSYQESLKQDQDIFRDDIVKLLIQMEESIALLLGDTVIDPKRAGRYDIEQKGAGHFHTLLAGEAQVMHDTVGAGLSIQHMLGQIARRQQEVRSLMEGESYETICNQLNIVSRRHTDGTTRPFVPTGQGESSIITGSGAGWEKEHRSPKFLELITLLRDIDTPEGGYIDTRDILVDFQTETPGGMMRTLPYVIIRIPRLNRTILIDDRIGEATFIFQGILDIDILRTHDKMELQVHHGAKKIIYDTKWGDTVITYLTTNWERESSGEATETNLPTSRVNLDRASLFIDRETIRDHLTRFAEAGGIAPAELLTSNPKENTEVTLSGGVLMKWNTFLINASGYLLGTRQGDTENRHRQAKALDRLCEMVGVVRINQNYFMNARYILADLGAFAEAGGVTLGGLSTGTPKPNTEVTLSNGVLMKWETLLKNASGYLFGTKQGDTENSHRRSEALDTLCEMVGVVRINRNYFMNTQYILADLGAFAEAGGVALAELLTSNPKPNTEVTLSNGAVMKWQTFLNNAGRYLLGTKQGDTENRHRKAEALDTLCEIVGVVRTTKKHKKS